jgi:hypothetical protein
MKKELLYFTAGAALSAAILYFLPYKPKPIDCDVIAEAANSDNDEGLTRKEKVAVAVIQERTDVWGDERDRGKPRFKRDAYKNCLKLFP